MYTCRCVASEKKYGSPVQCEHCKLNCAFKKSMESTKKVGGIWIVGVVIVSPYRRSTVRRSVCSAHSTTRRPSIATRDHTATGSECYRDDGDDVRCVVPVELQCPRNPNWTSQRAGTPLPLCQHCPTPDQQSRFICSFTCYNLKRRVESIDSMSSELMQETERLRTEVSLVATLCVYRVL